MSFRFEVAISFAGDKKRTLIREIAEILRAKLGEKKVFFDEWYEHEFAGIDADLVFQKYFRRDTGSRSRTNGTVSRNNSFWQRTTLCYGEESSW